jgi:hypothetical protein
VSPVNAESRLHYVVSTSESSLVFEARSTLHAVRGKATGLSGYVDLSWESDGTVGTLPPPAMHVEFPVDQLRTANALMDHEMHRLIGCASYPRIAADLRELHPDAAPAHFDAVGDITLAGRARRYEGTLTLSPAADRVTIDGELNVDIRDFGLRPPSLLIVKVDPVVRVRLRLIATRDE